MADYNRVILIGRITRDPEVRYVGSGTAVTDLGLAVNDRRKNQQTGEWVEETQFVDVTLWARQAEIAGEYLSKGSNVFIEGRLKLDRWEKDGQKNSKLRVIGEKMQFLDRKGEGGGGGGGGQGSSGAPQYSETEFSGAPAPSSGGQSAPPPDGDLPF